MDEMDTPEQERRWLPRIPNFALIAGGILILAALALGLAVSDARSQRKVAAGWERQTFEVLIETRDLLSALQNVETGQRGYLLTGEQRYLEPYNAGLAAVPRELKRLQFMVQDNPAQRASLSRLSDVIDQRLELLRWGISLKRSGDGEGATQLVASGRGKVLMDEARIILAGINRTETALLGERTAENDRLSRQSDLLVVGLLVLILGMAGFGILTLVAAARAHGKAELLEVEQAAAQRLREADAAAARSAALLNEQLEAKVAARTQELETALGVLRKEVEERESAEAQVRQMQKIESIGQLTGGIAHDFNNMLAVVLGSLEIVKRRIHSDPERAIIAAENAEEGARRAATLTARLLAFSRQQPLAPEPVDANKLVSGMSELLRSTIGEQVEIETVLAGGLWKTHIDTPQLENAILNLCVNARDAMPEGGKLTIETHNCHLDENYAANNPDVDAGEFVLVCVSDTGTGMAPDVIERSFDPFYTTKEVGKGTGLGLSQVYGFVKQSGGHIKIYSEDNEGTTIKLYLPRYFGSAKAGDRSASNDGENWPQAKPGEVVLVVEDEDQVRNVSTEQLRDLGYNVLEASDGAAALALLTENEQVDLIFTDIVMPGMTGRVLADEAVKLRADVKILYTTGYTRNAVVHNGVLDPGTEFIAKPYTGAALANKVRSVLDGK